MGRKEIFQGRVPCTIYLDPADYDTIEEKRGECSKNKFLNKIIKNAIKTGALNCHP